MGDVVAAVRSHVLAFLFGSAEVPYPTSVGHVRVVPIRSSAGCKSSGFQTFVLCLIQLHPCLVQHLSFSALLSSILSWWHHPSMDPSVRGQGDVLLPLVGSGWYILAVDLSKSQQPSSPSLATLFISICKPHNVTITQACIFLSHIPMATRGHSS